MKQQQRIFFIIGSLLVIFNFFFWKEKLAINLFIFSVLLSAAMLWLFPHLKSLKNALVSLAATLLVAGFVVVQNTHAGKLAFFILLAVAIGFIHQAAFRSALYAFANSALNLVATPANYWREFRSQIRHYPRLNKLFGYHRFIYIPVIVAVIFFVFYLAGDPQFFESTFNFLNNFANFVEQLFKYFSIERILFILLGAILLAAVFLTRDFKFLVNHEQKQKDDLVRERKRRKLTNNILTRSLFSSLALKNEFVKGTLTLILVNVLLLCVNVVDVVKVWVEGKSISYIEVGSRVSAAQRSVAVHEGTNTLIFSILFAIAILLFFFRGNLNFYKKNRSLKKLANFWIIQNVLLALTVALRNYYYIHDWGLTQKRIGVMIFLLLTIFGLITMFFKIRERKSLFYLVRINSSAACALLIVMSCINWDPLIASYNISHISNYKLDKSYLLSLSDHALPVLIQNKDALGRIDGMSADEFFAEFRILAFVNDYESHSWLSWNYADYKVYHFLIKQNLYMWTQSN